MKNKQAFTPAEMIIVLGIMGVLIVLTISSTKNIVNKNKALFKKGYSTIERNIVELINDENLYPYDPKNFGFEELTDVAIPGEENKCTSGTDKDETSKQCKGNPNALEKFCALLNNNLNVVAEGEALSSTYRDAKGNCYFTTTDSISWALTTTAGENCQNKNHACFLVTMDTNGKKDPNTPSQYSQSAYTKGGTDQWSQSVDSKNRDRFFVLVRYDGKVIIPSNDGVEQDYLRSIDFKDSDKNDE